MMASYHPQQRSAWLMLLNKCVDRKGLYIYFFRLHLGDRTVRYVLYIYIYTILYTMMIDSLHLDVSLCLLSMNAFCSLLFAITVICLLTSVFSPFSDPYYLHFSLTYCYVHADCTVQPIQSKGNNMYYICIDGSIVSTLEEAQSINRNYMKGNE